jgi:hypothetical protein
VEISMVVKNVNGTFRLPCTCGCWLKHWQRFGRPSRAFAQRQTCAVVVCRNPIEAGAHVQKEVLEGMGPLGLVGDASWYVVPLCTPCSQKLGAQLIVDDGCGLAPANLEETCGNGSEEDSTSMSA